MAAAIMLADCRCRPCCCETLVLAMYDDGDAAASALSYDAWPPAHAEALAFPGLRLPLSARFSIDDGPPRPK